MPQPSSPEDLYRAVSDLTDGFREVQQAILGDERLGHTGLVKRTRALEDLALAAPELHRAIEEKAAGSVARAHERMDALEEAFTVSLGRVEKKVDRLIWMIAGAGASGLLAGAGGAWAIITAAGGP